MRFLIDTHTFLWFIHDSPKLSANAKNLLESDNNLWVSIVSLWEIAIKVNIGKLTLPNSYEDFIPKQLALNDIEGFINFLILLQPSICTHAPCPIVSMPLPLEQLWLGYKL